MTKQNQEPTGMDSEQTWRPLDRTLLLHSIGSALEEYAAMQVSSWSNTPELEDWRNLVTNTVGESVIVTTKQGRRFRVLIEEMAA